MNYLFFLNENDFKKSTLKNAYESYYSMYRKYSLKGAI